LETLDIDIPIKTNFWSEFSLTIAGEYEHMIYEYHNTLSLDDYRKAKIAKFTQLAYEVYLGKLANQ
jgi:hypothetical protein